MATVAFARGLSSAAPTAHVQRDPWAFDPVITYEELKPLTEQPTDDVLLIDVREPDEVALGTIPSSVNLPLSEIEDALKDNFSAAEFKKHFAFSKPSQSQNIVFFCRSGRRSGIACEIAGYLGYPNTRNYAGSWIEWAEEEGA